MKKTVRPLFALIGVFIAAGGVFLFFETVVVLSVINLDDPANSFHFKMASPEKVTLFYINSMYNAPVEEVFDVLKGCIILKAVRTTCPAVMEYYGFEEAGPVKDLHRDMGASFLVQASMGQDQSLRVGKSSLSLNAIACGGDHILVRVDQVSPAKFAWWKIFQGRKANT